MTKEDLWIRFVDSVDDVPSFLWESCFAPPVEGRWWYDSLESCGIEDQFQFSYALICQGEVAVGLAPVFLMNVPIELVMPPALLPLFTWLGRLFPSVRYQRTVFVGSPCSDEGTVGLLPDVDPRQALLCLQRALEERIAAQGASMLVWKDIPQGLSGDFAWLMEQSRMFPMVSFPGTEVSLSSPSKAGYFAGLKASRRHLLKKKLRRSAQAIEVTTEIMQAPESAVLDEIFGLFWQTYEKAKTKFERLNRRFFELLAQLPACHFILLREREEGRLVAFMLCFALGDKMINKFIGIDYRQPRECFLYFRLWDAALEWALAQGFRSIQSGQTGYAPKIEMGHALVPLTNYCRHRNVLVHWVYGLIARTIGWHTLDDDLARFLKAHPDVAASSASPSQ